VAIDTNEASDYFIRDLKTRTTERVSVSSSETQANADSRQPIGIVQWAVSDDGRYVVFNSSASNLVAGDANGAEDIFVRDRRAGTTRRVSVSSSGGEADLGVGNRDTSSTYAVATSTLFVVPVNGTDLSYSATPNGRYVAFGSDATNLVPGDTNDTTDVFLRDTLTRTTGRVSVSSTGEEGDGPSNQPVLSADGRFVAFESAAQNLVAGDSNGSEDIFVHEVPRGEDVSGWF
jgi:Tol biopolymer transport system component